MERAAPERANDTASNAYIVNRLAATINVFKQFGTEEARETLHVLLGSVSPPVVDPTDHAARLEGMQRRVWERLNVRRGRRARTAQQKQADELGRPFVSLQATLTRQVFDAQVEAAKKPLKVGNTASPCPCPCPCPSVGKVLGQLAIVLVYTRTVLKTQYKTQFFKDTHSQLYYTKAIVLNVLRGDIQRML